MGVHVTIQPHHIVNRNALGDASYQLDAGIHRFRDSVAGEGRRHENQRHVGLRGGHCLAHRVENGNGIVKGLSAAARCNAGHYLRPIGFARAGVEATFPARYALHQNPRLLIQQDSHGVMRSAPKVRAQGPPPLRSACQ